jgi:ribose transport system substrate-binding protein
VVGLFSYSAPAALKAIEQVGRAGKLQVVGFDEADETQAGIAAGAIHSSILQDTPRIGYVSIEVLANEARGVAPGPSEQSPITHVGINVLTAKNLADLRDSGAIRQPGGAPSTKPAGE